MTEISREALKEWAAKCDAYEAGVIARAQEKGELPIADYVEEFPVPTHILRAISHARAPERRLEKVAALDEIRKTIAKRESLVTMLTGKIAAGENEITELVGAMKNASKTEKARLEADAAKIRKRSATQATQAAALREEIVKLSVEVEALSAQADEVL